MSNKRQIWPIAVALIILLIMFLTACARIDVSPPLFRLPEPPSRTVPGDYEVLWDRAIGWFDAHEAEITELDEEAAALLEEYEAAKAAHAEAIDRARHATTRMVAMRERCAAVIDSSAHRAALRQKQQEPLKPLRQLIEEQQRRLLRLNTS